MDFEKLGAFYLGKEYDLKEGLGPAVKAIKEGPNQTHIRQYAILTIAKFGDESHMPLLEEMLEDATVMTTQRLNNKSYQTQVRDVALAALVKLTGQDFKKFGFDRLQTHQQIVFNPSTLGFETDEARNKSLEAWKNFRAMKNKPQE